MAETLATYLSKAQQRVDDTSSAGVLTQFIKERYQAILEETKQFLISSVTNDRTATPGTATYTPQEFVEIVLNYKPVGGEFSILKEITEREYLEKYINDEAGTPHSYFLNDSSYVLVPAPSEAGTIRETMQVVQADVNGTSSIPDRYTNVLLDGVTADFKAWENNLPAANIYEAKYQSGLRKMFLELATRNKLVRPKIYRK